MSSPVSWADIPAGTAGAGAPSSWLFVTDPGRAVAEFGLLIAALPLGQLLPVGDGHPVLVLPGLLADGYEGKHVLVQGDQVLTVWDTLADALQAGYERFGLDVPFLCQPIDPEFLTYPWPEDILPRAGRTGA